MHGFRLLIPAALAAVVLPLALACGGDDNSDKKPAATLQSAATQLATTVSGTQSAARPGATQLVPTISATQSAARQQFCNDLSSFKTTAGQMLTVNTNTTLDDAKKMHDSLKASYDKMQASAKSLEQVKLDELNNAYMNFEKAFTALPPGTTMGAAATSLQAPATAVVQAEANVRVLAACPTS